MRWLPFVLVGLIFLPLLGWTLLGAWRSHCWEIWNAARQDVVLRVYPQAHPADKAPPLWVNDMLQQDFLLQRYTKVGLLPRLRLPGSRPRGRVNREAGR